MRAASFLVAVVFLASCEPAPSSPSPAVSSPSSSGSPSGSPVAAASPARVAQSADDGLFELVIWSPSSTWSAGEAIDVTADLSYDGPQATIEVFGSGSGLVTFGLEQLDGGLDVSGSWNLACVRYALARDEPISSGYRKSGGVSDGDPDAGLIEAFLADPIFRLPAGSFVVRATFVGAFGECGGETHSISVELPLTVVP